MNKTDYKKMFEEAEVYNKELSNISHPFENYGINTHRLLVRGVRVDGTADAYVPADAYQIEPKVVAVATTIALVTLAMVYVVISWIVKCRKRTAVKEKDEEI